MGPQLSVYLNPPAAGRPETESPETKRADRVALTCIVIAALVFRSANVAKNTYVVFPDETFQYFEPAHRLAFDAGVVTWEYLEGIRSWFLPGVLAGVMHLVSSLGGQQVAMVVVVRLLCSALSLAVPVLAFRLARREFGLIGASTAGLLCAVWLDLIYYAPTVLTEVVAAHSTLLGYTLSSSPRTRGDRRAAYVSGALYGFACCLRYQYATSIIALALLQRGFSLRSTLRTALVATAVVTAILGGLDWLTWGKPFQSVWLNFKRNAFDGLSSGMGVQSWDFPFTFFVAAWGPMLVFLVPLAAVGAKQAPALAATAAITLGLHALTPHKEARFLYLAIAIAPVLVGLGLARLLHGARLSAVMRRIAATVCVLALATGEALCATTTIYPPEAWHRGASSIAAFVLASRIDALCGLAVFSPHAIGSGGYTYLNRNVPIYFSRSAIPLIGTSNTLPVQIRVRGLIVPQQGSLALAEESGLFNVLVGTESEALPGYARVACFGPNYDGDTRLCVFERSGHCSEMPSQTR